LRVYIRGIDDPEIGQNKLGNLEGKVRKAARYLAKNSSRVRNTYPKFIKMCRIPRQ
jgi:hypothetical protein